MSLSRFKQLIASQSDYDGKINFTTKIRKLKFDSLDELELIIEIENEFDIEMNESDFSECCTVGNMYHLVKSYLSNL